MAPVVSLWKVLLRIPRPLWIRLTARRIVKTIFKSRCWRPLCLRIKTNKSVVVPLLCPFILMWSSKWTIPLNVITPCRRSMSKTDPSTLGNSLGPTDTFLNCKSNKKATVVSARPPAKSEYLIENEWKSQVMSELDIYRVARENSASKPPLFFVSLPSKGTWFFVPFI